MAIDYIIDYGCVPKDELGTQGIIERLKGEERARTIIKMFRDNGDMRPPSKMGFEFTRNTPDGGEEARLIVVQDLLDFAEPLKALEPHCEHCPANRAKRPFGCMGFVHYPISMAGEKWLLDRLPVPDDILVWMLLRQGVKEFNYDGHSVRPLRGHDGNVYFEDGGTKTRRLGEFVMDSNQLFEMIFSVGNILPNHGALLLLFVNGINRNIEADDIVSISPAPPDAGKETPVYHEARRIR